MITRTGADPFGDYVRAEIAGFGVDDRYVGTVAGYPTPVTFCEIFPPDDFPLLLLPLPKAPDLEIAGGRAGPRRDPGGRIFWATGTGLCAEPSREATLAALARPRRADGTPCSTSTSGRCSGPSPAEATRCAAGRARPRHRRRRQPRGVRGRRRRPRPRAAAEALLDRRRRARRRQAGPKGVLAVHRDGTVAEVPPTPVEVVNGLGAGDAFGGALCHGLLAGLGPRTRHAVRQRRRGHRRLPARLLLRDAVPRRGRRGVLEGGRAERPDSWRRPEDLARLRARRPRGRRRGGRPPRPQAAAVAATATRLMLDRRRPSGPGRARRRRRRSPWPTGSTCSTGCGSRWPGPGVDGVLATADILEDLLLLGALEDKVVIGSMNRGGLAGPPSNSTTGSPATAPRTLPGSASTRARLLLRIDHEDPARSRTLRRLRPRRRRAGRAADWPMLSSRSLPAGSTAGCVNDLTAEAVTRSIAIASGLGATSAYTWLKVPVGSRDMARVMATSRRCPRCCSAATSATDQDAAFEKWRAALQLPTVQGLVAGRSLLYPADGDVAAAVDTAVGLLYGVGIRDWITRTARTGRTPPRPTAYAVDHRPRSGPAGATPACGCSTCRPAPATGSTPAERVARAAADRRLSVTLRRHDPRPGSAGSSVFDGVTDFAYVPRDARGHDRLGAGGRFALPAARCERRLPVRHGAAPAYRSSSGAPARRPDGAQLRARPTPSRATG